MKTFKVQIINSLNFGGAEKNFYLMLKALISRDRHQLPVVYCTVSGEYGKRLASDGYVVLYGLKGFVHLVLMIFKARRSKVDIGCWMYRSILIGMLLKALVKIIRPKVRVRLFGHVRHGLNALNSESWSTQFEILLSGVAAPYFDLITFNSLVSRTSHADYWPLLARSCILKNIGEIYPPNQQLRNLPVERSHYRIVVIARFHPMKGFQFLGEKLMPFLDAINGQFQSRLEELVFIGKDVDSTSHKQMYDEVRQIRVRFLGFSREPWKTVEGLSKSLRTVVFLPSQFGESLSNVLIEAGQIGYPRIAFDIAANRDVTASGDLILDPFSREADMAKKIYYFLDSLTVLSDAEGSRLAEERRAVASSFIYHWKDKNWPLEILGL